MHTLTCGVAMKVEPVGMCAYCGEPYITVRRKNSMSIPVPTSAPLFLLGLEGTWAKGRTIPEETGWVTI